jgi:hypothetical protein
MRISQQKIRSIINETLNEQATTPRPIRQIALEIKRSWKNVNPAAKPYLDAMMQLNSVSDDYGADDGESIVLYFLSNASGWRDPDAKRLKDELKAALKVS